MAMCNHLPFKSKNRVIAFLYLLISPRVVFTYYTDGADFCASCGSEITVPYFYYSGISKAIYAVFGIITYIILAPIVRKVPVFCLIASFLCMLIFHHIYSAAVFSFAAWDAHDLNVRSFKSCAEQAKSELAQKVWWFFLTYFETFVFYSIFI